MIPMERKQTISICLALGCLVIGSAIYVFFRPPTLLMFHWADSLLLTKLICTMRTYVHGFDKYLPVWIVYSLPFALWVSSYLFFIRAVWWNSTSRVHHAWFWSIPLIAIGAELAQSIYIIPGHFDLIDLITIIFASVLVFILTNFNVLNKGEIPSKTKT